MPPRDASRRRFLSLSGQAWLSGLLARRFARADAVDEPADAAAAAHAALERVLPEHATQIHLSLEPRGAAEFFRIAGSTGTIAIAGSTASALLMGAHAYLRQVAGVSVSWNGDCLERLPARLPAPPAPLRQSARVQHRFALNDTNDGYTGPYWTWNEWERLIDVLVLHGINEVLVYMGAEAVYQQTFRHFGMGDEAMRRWLPTPAHQPWWLLENLSGWVGPSTSQQVIDARLALGRRITGRLRELGMTPVLPGYYGMVPDGFAEKNPDARIVPQGTWLGMKRPDWLDPTCDVYPRVAAAYYRTQEELLGPTTMVKMDPLHEGGSAGTVNLTEAARALSTALERARPGATWALLGWMKNPRAEVLAGVQDKSRVLILDGQSDRYAYADREQEWDNTPYAFGTIWNFGGKTTMGANLGVWNERYFRQLNKPESRLNGIAVMPEASCNNPAAFAFFTELAWRSEPVDLRTWFAQWPARRYGGTDAYAAQAWEVLRRTAYDMPSGEWSEAHDNLFSAQPSLTTQSACSWAPKDPRYDLRTFSGALGALRQVNPALRGSSAYRYDLVDVARQTLANHSRVLLPQIHAAYGGADRGEFRKLTHQWLEEIDALNRVVATEPALLLGRWVSGARAAGANAAEERQLEFDACSLLVEWGPAASWSSGVHDYANREWNGLLDYYHARWAAYFAALEAALDAKEPMREIDWFAMDQDWAQQRHTLATEAQGDAYAVIHALYGTGWMQEVLRSFSG